MMSGLTPRRPLVCRYIGMHRYPVACIRLNDRRRHLGCCNRQWGSQVQCQGLATFSPARVPSRGSVSSSMYILPRLRVRHVPRQTRVGHRCECAAAKGINLGAHAAVGDLIPSSARGDNRNGRWRCIRRHTIVWSPRDWLVYQAAISVKH